MCISRRMPGLCSDDAKDESSYCLDDETKPLLYPIREDNIFQVDQSAHYSAIYSLQTTSHAEPNLTSLHPPPPKLIFVPAQPPPTPLPPTAPAWIIPSRMPASAACAELGPPVESAPRLRFHGDGVFFGPPADPDEGRPAPHPQLQPMWDTGVSAAALRRVLARSLTARRRCRGHAPVPAFSSALLAALSCAGR